MGLPEMTDLSTSGSFFFFSFLRFSFLLFCGRTGAEASACAGRGYCGYKLTDFFSFLLFLSFFSFFSRLCFFLPRTSAWRGNGYGHTAIVAVWSSRRAITAV